MAKVKELKYGKKIEDLDKFYKVDFQRGSFQQLVNTCAKVRKAGEEAALAGDEEMAYIQLMKYFAIIQHIYNMPEYKIKKKFTENTLGGNEAHRRLMSKLESLQLSLQARYARLNDQELATKPRGMSSTFDSRSIVTNGSTQNTFNVNTNFISCENLFELMQGFSVLVMDCRPSADYRASRLKYKYVVNIPEEYIIPGMSAGKLQDKLDGESKALWAARAIKDEVVLMDWSSGSKRTEDSAAIDALMDILKKWDPDTVYRAPIRILEGGYESFLTTYPIVCSNPKVQPPTTRINNNLSIDTIVYPSLSDINTNIQTRAAIKQPPTPPAIDRSRKMTAINAYKEKDRTITELLKDQNVLMMRARKTDEDIMKTTIQLEELVRAKRMRRDGADVLFNLLELQSNTKDNELKNQHFRKQWEEIARNRHSDLTIHEAQQMADIELNIKERESIDHKHNLENDSRELLIAEANVLRKQTNVAANDQPPASPTFSQPGQSLQAIGTNAVLKSNNKPYDEDKENNFIAAQTLPPSFDRAMKPVVKPADAATSFKLRDYLPVSSRNVRPGLTGLQNLGNTCYMNSILQCLSHTQDFKDYCITDKYKAQINRTNRTRGAIIEEVAELLKVLWSGNYKSVACRDFCQVIGQYQQTFRGSDQQDSHEFLTILVDMLHSDLQTLTVQIRQQENLGPAESAWLDFTKACESRILHLFYGQIKSTVRCQTCSNESSTYECFSNLSLELPSSANLSYLQDCLNMYFKAESVCDWHCPNCNQKRYATKQLSIFKLPPMMVIHLKRFYADMSFGSSNGYKKKQELVRFPLEGLDLRPYLADTDLPSNVTVPYDLYGVSNHYGTMESGHYTAFCRNRSNWFKFDDSLVTEHEQSSVVSSGAYILFYAWRQPIS